MLNINTLIFAFLLAMNFTFAISNPATPAAICNNMIGKIKNLWTIGQFKGKLIDGVGKINVTGLSRPNVNQVCNDVNVYWMKLDCSREKGTISWRCSVQTSDLSICKNLKPKIENLWTVEQFEAKLIEEGGIVVNVKGLSRPIKNQVCYISDVYGGNGHGGNGHGMKLGCSRKQASISWQCHSGRDICYYASLALIATTDEIIQSREKVSIPVPDSLYFPFQLGQVCKFNGIFCDTRTCKDLRFRCTQDSEKYKFNCDPLLK